MKLYAVRTGLARKKPLFLLTVSVTNLSLVYRVANSVSYPCSSMKSQLQFFLSVWKPTKLINRLSAQGRNGRRSRACIHIRLPRRRCLHRFSPNHIFYLFVSIIFFFKSSSFRRKSPASTLPFDPISASILHCLFARLLVR